VQQHEEGTIGEDDEAFENKLQDNPTKTRVPKRSNVPLFKILHELVLQGWTEKSLCQKSRKEVHLPSLQGEEEEVSISGLFMEVAHLRAVQSKKDAAEAGAATVGF